MSQSLLKLFGKSLQLFFLFSFLEYSYAAPPSINPFADASFYVDPDYVSKTEDFFNEYPAYKNKAQKLNLLNNSNQWNISTAIWLDRKAAIYDTQETHGVYWHLVNAYNKATSTMVITFVIYDLPGRDCDAFSSNGEIKIALNNQGQPDVKAPLIDYKDNFIDPVHKELTRFYTDYPDAAERLRTVLIIEPDSLPNMITNKDHTANYPNSCKIIAENHVYERGIKYALQTFSATDFPIYMYLDIAHSGWLGWKSNANQIFSVYNNNGDTNVKNYPYSTNESGLGAGFNAIRGFITNTANYTPFQESFNSMNDARKNYEFYTDINNHILNSNFYEWNDSYDEASFIAEILSLDNSDTPKLHFDTQYDHRIIRPPNGAHYNGMHFLVDTSRNNWNDNGASNLRKDQRHHRGNWCNIGAGMGARPQANPSTLNPLDPLSNQTLPIDAFVWIKPPGESDGNFDPSNHEGDQMCGAGTGGTHNQNSPTDALQGLEEVPAPHAGEFFPQAFMTLIDKASE